MKNSVKPVPLASRKIIALLWVLLPLMFTEFATGEESSQSVISRSRQLPPSALSLQENKRLLASLQWQFSQKNVRLDLLQRRDQDSQQRMQDFEKKEHLVARMIPVEMRYLDESGRSDFAVHLLKAKLDLQIDIATHKAQLKRLGRVEEKRPQSNDLIDEIAARQANLAVENAKALLELLSTELAALPKSESEQDRVLRMRKELELRIAESTLQNAQLEAGLAKATAKTEADKATVEHVLAIRLIDQKLDLIKQASNDLEIASEHFDALETLRAEKQRLHEQQTGTQVEIAKLEQEIEELRSLLSEISRVVESKADSEEESKDQD